MPGQKHRYLHPTGKPPEDRTRTENRFWNKVDVGHPDDCWQWTGASDRYGRIWTAGTTELAHRVAFMLDNSLDAVEDIPGDVIKHRCHETLCCNPAHLDPGSQSENLTDACVEGDRDTRFDDAEIREIKRLNDNQEYTQTDVAEIFGVSHQLISEIVRGEYYSWVE